MMSEINTLKAFVDEIILLTEIVYEIATSAINNDKFNILYEKQSPFTNDFYDKWKNIYDIKLYQQGIQINFKYSISVPISFYTYLKPFNIKKLQFLKEILEDKDDLDSYFLKLYDNIFISSFNRQISNTRLECLRFHLFLYNMFGIEYFKHKIDILEIEPEVVELYNPIYLEEFGPEIFRNNYSLITFQEIFIPDLKFWKLGCIIVPTEFSFDQNSNNKVDLFPYGEIRDEKDQIFMKLYRIDNNIAKKNSLYNWEVVSISYAINTKYFYILDQTKKVNYNNSDDLFSLFINKDTEIIELLSPDWSCSIDCSDFSDKEIRFLENQESQLYRLIKDNLDIIANIVNLSRKYQFINKKIHSTLSYLGLIILRFRLSFYSNNILIEVKSHNKREKTFLNNLSDFFSGILLQSLAFKLRNSLLIYTWVDEKDLVFFEPLIETLRSMGLEVDFRHNYRLDFQHTYLLPSSRLLSINNNCMDWDFNDVPNPDDPDYYNTLIDEETEFEMKNKDRIKTFLKEIEKFI